MRVFIARRKDDTHPSRRVARDGGLSEVHDLTEEGAGASPRRSCSAKGEAGKGRGLDPSMGEAPRPPPSWRMSLKAAAALLSVVIGMFTVVELLTQQPVVALLLAALGGVGVSVYYWRKGFVTETILAWLVIAVVCLSIHSFYPRTVNVVGTLYNRRESSVGGETVFLIDARGIERRAITDPDGRFEFLEVPMGHFDLTAGVARIGGEAYSPFAREIRVDIYMPSPDFIALTPTP